MIRTEAHGRVTLLRIDRHEARNALNPEHVNGLRDGLAQAVADGQRCAVITGEGSSFCAGADLDVVGDPAFREVLAGFVQGIAELPVPVIAAVNGPAIGLGAQLALACDLRVAAPRARFAVPTARLGLALDSWSVRRLVALTGGGPARALLLGVDTLDVERAHTLGLVDRLGDLDAALAWAGELAALAPLTLQYNKLALNAVADLAGSGDEARTGSAVEQAFAACWASQDAKESLLARAQGRSPEFTGT
jgi:enoyl-CoA hydratase